jgi:hypothetical protein
MPDIIETFGGSAGAVTSHTPNSGGSCSTDGSGNVYTSGTATEGHLPVTSATTPADCAVSMVCGADGVSSAAVIGFAVRVQGAAGSQSYYAIQADFTAGRRGAGPDGGAGEQV